MGNYSSGDAAALPGTSADLSHVYDATDLTNVGTDDTNYVNQTGSSGYELHQYKDSITAGNATVTWKGKSSLAPSSSKVQLQVYKVAAPAGWQDVSGAGASNNVAAADTDFTLSGTIATADYLDSGVTTFRIYQAASAGGTATIGEGTVGGNACTYTGCEDTTMYVNAGTANYGGRATMFMNSTNPNITQVNLIKFSGLSNLSGKTVTAVKLFINYHDRSGTHTILGRRVVAGTWIEGTQDGAPEENSVCWDFRKYAAVEGDRLTWNTAGALGVGTDVSATTSFSKSLSADGFAEITDAQLVTDVQDMIDNTSTNYGWQIYIAATDTAGNTSESSESATAASRPYLEVTYTG